MKRLMVMAVTSVALFGCAASQYKFSCNGGVCDVETSGPATLDFKQEFGETLQVIETKDDHVTMEAGGSRATFQQLEKGTLGKLKISVENIKGEHAFFSVSE